jgi:hypothetical protein
MSVELTELSLARDPAAPNERLLREWLVVAVLFALIAGWVAFLAWAAMSFVARLL